jgi:hypothetical protein
MPSVVEVVIQMARKLQGDVAALGRLRGAGKPKTFPQFREIRNKHHEISGLIFSIQERLDSAKQHLPPNFAQWVLRQKLTSLAIFTDISHQFIGNPPLALTSSLGAFDLLVSERQSFQEALQYFDTLLFEAGIDDKMADELDATRCKIEEILQMIEKLLTTSPKILEEF